MTPFELEAIEITKRFGGIVALDDVSLSVANGELVGLVGPNGAGKTTLFDCLLGTTHPDRGDVRLGGRSLGRMAVHRRARLGMGRTFQRLELFSEMTVRDHLLVADRAHRGHASLLRDLLNRSAPTAAELDEVDATLELVGLAAEADRPVESLTLGHGRLVELARALMTSPAVLLVDEPSSGLDRDESAALGAVLRTVNAERGMAVLLVEHDLDLVCAVVSRLYVLDFGRMIADGAPDDVLADVAVRRAYLGETVG